MRVNSRGSNDVSHMSRSFEVAAESAMQGMSASVAVSADMFIQCIHTAMCTLIVTCPCIVVKTRSQHTLPMQMMVHRDLLKDIAQASPAPSGYEDKVIPTERGHDSCWDPCLVAAHPDTASSSHQCHSPANNQCTPTLQSESSLQVCDILVPMAWQNCADMPTEA